MGPKLQALRELQDIELQIVDIRRQLARREKAVAAQEQRLSALSEQIAAERADLQRFQVQVNEIDVDVRARESHIEKLRARLNSVRTNKEYAAVLSELNNEKADVSKVEARALEMLDRLEKQKGALEQRQHTVEHERDRLRDLQTQLDQAQQLFSGKLTSLQQQHDRAREAVDAGSLSLFERLSERYEGEALARIDRVHPRRDEFTCGGCYMSLSAEVANGCLTRDEVTTCKNCGRILYMEKGT
jgi:predicted  nucleic acid-binding Zn-ribbon protein